MLNTRDFYGRPIFLAGAPSPYAGFGPIGEYQRRKFDGFQSLPEYMTQFQRAGGQGGSGSSPQAPQPPTTYPPAVDIDYNTDNPPDQNTYPPPVDVDVNTDDPGSDGGGGGDGTGGDGDLVTVADNNGFPVYKIDQSGNIYDMDGNPIGTGADPVSVPGGDAVPSGSIFGGIDISGAGGNMLSPGTTISIGGAPNPMALLADHPYTQMAGLMSFLPGAGQLLSLGMLGLGELLDIGGPDSGDYRYAGYQVADKVLPYFFENVLQRNPDEVYGQFGASDADRTFIEGWRDSTVGGPSTSDYSYLPFDYNEIYDKYASNPDEMLKSLLSYYQSLDPAARPAFGDVEGWADLGTSQQQLAADWVNQAGYGNLSTRRGKYGNETQWYQRDQYNPYGGLSPVQYRDLSTDW